MESTILRLVFQRSNQATVSVQLFSILVATTIAVYVPWAWGRCYFLTGSCKNWFALSIERQCTFTNIIAVATSVLVFRRDISLISTAIALFRDRKL